MATKQDVTAPRSKHAASQRESAGSRFGTDPDLAPATAALEIAGANNAVAVGWLAQCLRLQAGTSPDPEGMLRDAVRLLEQVLQALPPQTPALPG